MLQLSSRGSELTLFLLRAGAGLMLFYFHGMGKATAAYANLVHGQEWKFIGFVASLGFPFATVFATCAALAESVGALFLAAGLFTRYSSIAVAFTMLVAVYHHARSDMKIELAAIYFLISLVFVFVQSGKLSVDSLLFNRLRVKAKTARETAKARG